MSLAAARLIDLPSAKDARGTLTSIEGGRDVPFEIRRVFYMHGTPEGVERGGHAHRDTRQVIVPLAGRFKVELSDGREARTYELADPNSGLFMPAMIFARLYDFSPNAFCLVLADTHYDRSRSIRTWDEFLTATRVR